MTQVGMASNTEYAPRYLQDLFFEQNRVEKRDIRSRYSQLCFLVCSSILAHITESNKASPMQDLKLSL